jgi:predicted kinase
MKTLFLLRGLPGAGKSTLADSLGIDYVEADMFFMQDGEYKFDGTKIKLAHEWCQDRVRKIMELGMSVAVANTFTQEWEMEPYLEMAEEFGYRVNSLIVENRHGNESVHGVPAQAMDIMEKRFEIKLR